MKAREVLGDAHGGSILKLHPKCGCISDWIYLSNILKILFRAVALCTVSGIALFDELACLPQNSTPRQS